MPGGTSAPVGAAIEFDRELRPAGRTPLTDPNCWAVVDVSPLAQWIEKLLSERLSAVGLAVNGVAVP